VKIVVAVGQVRAILHILIVFLLDAFLQLLEVVLDQLHTNPSHLLVRRLPASHERV
jgi:hypothetical protein